MRDGAFIRPGREQDIPAMVALWLQASLLAHNFIPEEYWLSHADDMRNIYLPQSENWVLEERPAGRVIGFLSLVGHHIAALFIDPSFQGQGFGKSLAAHAKKRHGELTLNVYTKNSKAVRFYKRQGFCTISRGVDEATRFEELSMRWRRSVGAPSASQ